MVGNKDEFVCALAIKSISKKVSFISKAAVSVPDLVAWNKQLSKALSRDSDPVPIVAYVDFSHHYPHTTKPQHSFLPSIVPRSTPAPCPNLPQHQHQNRTTAPRPSKPPPTTTPPTHPTAPSPPQPSTSTETDNTRICTLN